MLVVSLASAPAMAQTEGTVVGNPELSLSVADNHYTGGEKAKIGVQVSNNGQLLRGGPGEYETMVKTARDVQMDIDEEKLDQRYDGKFNSKSGTTTVGSIPEGSAGPVSFKVEIDETIEPGTYKIPIEVKYDYYNWVSYSSTDAPTYHNREKTVTRDVQIVIEDRPRFDVDFKSDEPVIAGDSAPRNVQITNVGSATATDAEFQVSSQNPGIFFDGLRSAQRNTSVYVGELEPGETTSVSVTVGAKSEKDPGVYPLTSQFKYENNNGVPEFSKAKNLEVRVGSEQEFVIEQIESTLRVDGDGDVKGVLKNSGPETVSNVVLVYKSENSNLYPRETEYAMGTLQPGESHSFEYRIDVSSEAEAGPRQLSFQARYRNTQNDIRKTDPIDASVNIGAERDEFELERLDTKMTTGESKTISIRVRNDANQSLENIEAKMFTDDPLSSGDDTAYIDSLEPGASSVMKFEVSASENAIAKEYPISIDFSYEDERGETELSDTYRVGVTLEEQEEEEPPYVAIIGIALGLTVIVVWWKRDTISNSLR